MCVAIWTRLVLMKQKHRTSEGNFDYVSSLGLLKMDWLRSEGRRSRTWKRWHVYSQPVITLLYFQPHSMLSSATFYCASARLGAEHCFFLFSQDSSFHLLQCHLLRGARHGRLNPSTSTGDIKSHRSLGYTEVWLWLPLKKKIKYQLRCNRSIEGTQRTSFSHRVWGIYGRAKHTRLHISLCWFCSSGDESEECNIMLFWYLKMIVSEMFFMIHQLVTGGTAPLLLRQRPRLAWKRTI